MHTKKTLSCTVSVIVISLLSGCSMFSGQSPYFRDRSVDYVHEKEIHPVQIPEQGKMTTPLSVMPIPERENPVKDASQKLLDPNRIPLPSNAVMHAGSYSYELFPSPQGAVIESDANQATLRARVLGWLKEGHIRIKKDDKVRGVIETGWFIPKGQKQYGWLYRTYSQVFSKVEDQEKALALRFTFSTAKQPGFFNVTVLARQKPAERIAKTNQDEGEKASGVLVNGVSQELLVYMIEHSGDQVDSEKGDFFNADTMTAMIQDGNGNPLLKIQSSFDTAWKETEKALKKSGFTVRKANHVAGIFYIVLTGHELENSQKNGVTKANPDISQEFTDDDDEQKDPALSPIYRLVLAPVNDGVYVSLEKNIDTIAPVSLSQKVLTEIRQKMKKGNR